MSVAVCVCGEGSALRGECARGGGAGGARARERLLGECYVRAAERPRESRVWRDAAVSCVEFGILEGVDVWTCGRVCVCVWRAMYIMHSVRTCTVYSAASSVVRPSAECHIVLWLSSVSVPSWTSLF
jgi:hypothetical protein